MNWLKTIFYWGILHVMFFSLLVTLAWSWNHPQQTFLEWKKHQDIPIKRTVDHQKWQEREFPREVGKILLTYGSTYKRRGLNSSTVALPRLPIYAGESVWNDREGMMWIWLYPMTLIALGPQSSLTFQEISYLTHLVDHLDHQMDHQSAGQVTHGNWNGHIQLTQGMAAIFFLNLQDILDLSTKPRSFFWSSPSQEVESLKDNPYFPLLAKDRIYFNEWKQKNWQALGWQENWRKILNQWQVKTREEDWACQNLQRSFLNPQQQTWKIQHPFGLISASTEDSSLKKNLWIYAQVVSDKKQSALKEWTWSSQLMWHQGQDDILLKTPSLRLFYQNLRRVPHVFWQWKEILKDFFQDEKWLSKRCQEMDLLSQEAKIFRQKLKPPTEKIKSHLKQLEMQFHNQFPTFKKEFYSREMSIQSLRFLQENIESALEKSNWTEN
jgi:hypothetical protein